jgi:cytochrome d ubiquinol oxidase subunit II
VAGLFVLCADAHRLYTHLLHRGWPLIAVSLLAGASALLATTRQPARVHPAVVRVLGALAVAALPVGWGVAQYPYLLGTRVSLHDAAAPAATMNALGVVSVAAVALVAPSLAWLFWLTQRGRLTDSEI